MNWNDNHDDDLVADDIFDGDEADDADDDAIVTGGNEDEDEDNISGINDAYTIDGNYYNYADSTDAGNDDGGGGSGVGDNDDGDDDDVDAHKESFKSE
jgi:hypothetical protein